MVVENNERIARLKNYVMEMHAKGDEHELYAKYQADIDSVTPQETFRVFNDLLLDSKLEPRDVLVFIERVMDALDKNLKEYKYDDIANYKFIKDLDDENNALLEKIEAIEDLLEKEDAKSIAEELSRRAEELAEFIPHYVKKEVILFPFMEKNDPKFVGVSIMWALHDVVRDRLKKTISVKDEADIESGRIKHRFANLFQSMRGLTNQEKLILFPSAIETLKPEDWDEMYKQSFEYEFPFIDKEVDIDLTEVDTDYGDYVFKTDTGELTFNQMLLVMNHLPVDITFVDETGKVKFFNKPEERYFARSPAVIGREVQNCHPPDSLDKVLNIVEAFATGKKDNARFWINLRGKLLLIQFFALRNAAGEFKGAIEVVQDITDFKDIEGERRLLDWEE